MEISVNLLMVRTSSSRYQDLQNGDPSLVPIGLSLAHVVTATDVASNTANRSYVGHLTESFSEHKKYQLRVHLESS